jgi:hypothetical protein
MKKLLVMLLLTCSLSFVLKAQPLPEDGDGQSGSVPIDGGLSLLLAAGAAYGVHRLGRSHVRIK